jgi:cobaltochelatase CobT
VTGLPGLGAALAAALLLLFAVAWALRRWGVPGHSLAADGPPDEVYRVFTRAYDRELAAAEVQAALPSASPDAEKGWYQADHALWPEAVDRLAKLLAEDAADAGWDEAAAKVRTAAERLDPQQLIVSLLIDQSGSMKGERIIWAAVVAVRLVDLLAQIGARSEVLGFTTAGWHGGDAYLAWRKAGRPPRPGRLCALMHVVYKGANDEALSKQARDAIVEPALLRENVDGEAMLWAHGRLAVRSEQHKLLIVISDGAPVDDATLLHNGPNYLYRHLMTVFDAIALDTSVMLGGIGIEHRVNEYYPISETIGGPDDLAAATGALLARMIEARAGA